MSIHKVTNTFVGNGSKLETSVNTLTPGKLGLFTMANTALAGNNYAASSDEQKIQVSETFADGSFKKSMLIDGASVIGARGKQYTPATREIWAIGYNRQTTVGSIEVNNASDYTASIRFKNDKSLYSERPEMLRINFTSSATATQLSIATQIAAAINNSGYKTLVKAIVVTNGTGAYGVEITALDINQFRSSTYKENRVYFSVQVEDSTGFGSSTACTQIVANSYGEGTYNYIYNKENFDYQYEGLSNRRLWPAQQVSFNVSNTGYLTAAIGVNVSGSINEDKVTFASDVSAIIRVGELVQLDGVMYEVKFLNAAGTVVFLTTPLTAAITSGDKARLKYFYNMIVLEFTDNSFTSGADLISVARKSVYIASPAINVDDTYDKIAGGSTEAADMLSALNDWLSTTPAAPVITFAV